MQVACNWLMVHVVLRAAAEFTALRMLHLLTLSYLPQDINVCKLSRGSKVDTLELLQYLYKYLLSEYCRLGLLRIADAAQHSIRKLWPGYAKSKQLSLPQKAWLCTCQLNRLTAMPCDVGTIT